MTKPVALTIAGSDPSGGAGLQADLKTFAAHGVHGASVVSVLTAQNSHRFDLLPVQPAFISAQIDAVFEEFDVRAVKIGMLANQQAVQVVIDALHRYAPEGVVSVILDPVIRASNGGLALDARGLGLLREQLLPLAVLIKPNLDEAALLLEDEPATNPEQMKEQALRLLAHGSKYVLLSGGHLAGSEIIDVLCHDGNCVTFRSSKLAGGDVHGTGCTLTSAIAANIANGHDVGQSVRLARAYLLRLLAKKHQLNSSGDARSLDHLPFRDSYTDK